MTRSNDGRQVVAKVVELLRNVDFTRDSGSTKPRNELRFGQGYFLVCQNKNLQIVTYGCIIKLKWMISNL